MLQKDQLIIVCSSKCFVIFTVKTLPLNLFWAREESGLTKKKSKTNNIFTSFPPLTQFVSPSLPELHSQLKISKKVSDTTRKRVR